MLFWKKAPVYCENNMQHVNTMREELAQFVDVTAGDTYSNQCALNVKTDCDSLLPRLSPGHHSQITQSFEVIYNKYS
jgi:hypothetical protein